MEHVMITDDVMYSKCYRKFIWKMCDDERKVLSTSNCTGSQSSTETKTLRWAVYNVLCFYFCSKWYQTDSQSLAYERRRIYCIRSATEQTSWNAYVTGTEAKRNRKINMNQTTLYQTAYNLAQLCISWLRKTRMKNTMAMCSFVFDATISVRHMRPKRLLLRIDCLHHWFVTVQYDLMNGMQSIDLESSWCSKRTAHLTCCTSNMNVTCWFGIFGFGAFLQHRRLLFVENYPHLNIYSFISKLARSFKIDSSVERERNNLQMKKGNTLFTQQTLRTKDNDNGNGENIHISRDRESCFPFWNFIAFDSSSKN